MPYERFLYIGLGLLVYICEYMYLKLYKTICKIIKITGMKYLMQILLGLILLQLLQSCDYSKSRDVLWMKKISKIMQSFFLMLLIYLITLFQ